MTGASGISRRLIRPDDAVGRLAAELRAECADDYVGLWQISRAIGEDAGGAEHAEVITAVVAAMLEDGSVAIGQFADGEFVEWPESRDRVPERLLGELRALGRKPDIGDVAWLVQRTR